jgi:hypothetical protein
MKKLITIGILLLFFITGLIPPVFILMLNEPVPIDFLKREFLQDEVPQGGLLRLHIVARRQNRCAIDVSRTIVDSSGAIWQTSQEQNNTDEDFVLNLRVPRDASVGPAKSHTIIEWKCNFIQKIFPDNEELPQMPFMIVQGQS